MKKIERDEYGEIMGELSFREKAGLYGGSIVGTLLFILIILSFIIPQCCPAVTPAELDRLIPALIQVESGGRSDAVGDGGKAYGILQIHTNYLSDGNRFAGTEYTHAEMFDPEKSIEISRAYLIHYARGKDIEATARIHNGGPTGWKKTSTDKYWNKVKKELR